MVSENTSVRIKTWRKDKINFYIGFAIPKPDLVSSHIYVLSGIDKGPGESRNFSHSRLWFYEDDQPELRFMDINEAREIWSEATRKGYTRYR